VKPPGAFVYIHIDVYLPVEQIIEKNAFIVRSIYAHIPIVFELKTK
jgi:hypothetical protein